MACTFLTTTERPPIRLPEPGRICSVVTPPSSAVSKSRILRPDRMFGPDVGGDRAGHFIAVLDGLHAGTRIHAEVRVDVDDAGRDPAALGIDDVRAGGRLQISSDGLMRPFTISTSAFSRRVPVPVRTVALRMSVGGLEGHLIGRREGRPRGALGGAQQHPQHGFSGFRPWAVAPHNR